MALGQNIKRLRKAQGLSQDQLAAKAGGGITQGIIAALEKRDSETSKHAARIAAALGVSVDALLTGEGPPTEKPAAPALNPKQQQALLGLFDGLTQRQQEDLIRELQEKKQQNEELLTELLKRKTA